MWQLWSATFISSERPTNPNPLCPVGIQGYPIHVTRFDRSSRDVQEFNPMSAIPSHVACGSARPETGKFPSITRDSVNRYSPSVQQGPISRCEKDACSQHHTCGLCTVGGSVSLHPCLLQWFRNVNRMRIGPSPNLT